MELYTPLRRRRGRRGRRKNRKKKEKEKKKRKEEEETEEVTQNYNFVADRWAGAYKSMPHLLPHTHNRITLNAHFYTFQLYHHRPTDQHTHHITSQTNGLTDD